MAGVIRGLRLVLATIALGTVPVAAYNNGLDRVPPMGWSNWEHFGCNIDEGLFHRSADALVAKGLAAVGYTLVGVDDCWAQLERNASGHLVANATMFPSGMRALGDYLHVRGLKLRIYSSAGTTTCQNNMSGSLGNEWIDAQTFADMGADALKYDDCGKESGPFLKDGARRYPFDEPALLRYPLMTMALNKTGRNISYLCNFPWDEWTRDWPAKGGRWAPEVCNSWRTSSDAQAGFDSSFAVVHHAETFADEVPSGPGAWNHLDALQIGNDRSFIKGQSENGPPVKPMTEAQERTIFSLFAMVKTPLMIGADVITLEGHSLATYLNKEVIDVNQDLLGARGRLMKPSSTLPPSCELWSVRLSDGGRFALMVNNQASNTANLSLSWNDLGLHANDAYHVRDVWQHSDLGIFRVSFTATVAPGSSIAVRLRTAVATVPAPAQFV